MDILHGGAALPDATPTGGPGTTVLDLHDGTGIAWTTTRVAGKVVATPAITSAVPGTELDYAQITMAVTGTATIEAGAATVVTGNNVTYDGSTTVMIEFFAPSASHSVADTAVAFVLYDVTGAVSLGFLAQVFSPVASGAVVAYGRRRITPVAGARQYAVKMFGSAAGTTTVNGGPGTAGNWQPAFIRITRV